jgi:hypothetical protein
MRFQKTQKKNIGLQWNMKFNLVTFLVLNWVCPIFYFPECFQPTTIANTCTLAINVFELGPFNPKAQYFTPLFNKISWFCEQQPRKDEASNEGCNSHPIGHDFINNFNTLATLTLIILVWHVSFAQVWTWYLTPFHIEGSPMVPKMR